MSDGRVLTQSRGGGAVKIAAVLGWFALLLQLYLILALRWQAGKSLLGGLDIFFSYFTVLTNILAAAIIVVGLAYNLLLRNTWNPQGLQWVADELLHDVMPVLFVIYWWFCVPKGTLQWRDVWPWLIYPAVYFVYALVRGSLVDSYPYPFIDVNQLGYSQVLVNALMVLVGFVVVSLLVIAVDRWHGKR